MFCVFARNSCTLSFYIYRFLNLAIESYIISEQLIKEHDLLHLYNTESFFPGIEDPAEVRESTFVNVNENFFTCSFARSFHGQRVHSSNNIFLFLKLHENAGELYIHMQAFNL